MTGRDKADWSKKRPMRIKVITGLAWPCLTPMDIYTRNHLHPTINPNQEGPHKERISQGTCINEDLPYKERSSPPKNECQLYATIKTPKPSQTKVRITYPRFGTLELWRKFSNLTFKGSLAGITSILSWGLLFLCCAGVVLSTWGLCDLLRIFGIIKCNVVHIGIYMNRL